MDTIRPLDLILFAGSEAVSSLIKFIEYRTLTDHSGGKVIPGEFSHVGVAVTSDILEHPEVKPGRLYIMESTMSGKYGQQLGNIDGTTNMCGGFLGVQVRDLDLLAPKYLKTKGTQMGVGHLINNPIDAMDKHELKRLFTDVYYRYNGITYDANCCSLCAAAFPFMRPFRSEVESLMETRGWLFCSELVAQIYKDMGIVPIDVNVKNVLPMDFIGYEQDKNGVQNIIALPPTPIHFE